MKPFELKIKFFVIATLLAAFFSACEKESAADLTMNEIDTNSIDNIVDLTNKEFLRNNITGGDEDSPIQLKNDGLIDEYVASSEQFDNSSSIPVNRLIHCLISVNLTPEQKPLVRRAVMAFQLRNKTLIMEHRQAVHELNKAKELRRRYFASQFRSGEITYREFLTKMAELRQKYIEILTGIKESNATDFARSFRLLLNNLNEILESDQWLRFTGCLREALN